jgi:uncharacterized protein (TIGR03067 family)
MNWHTVLDLAVISLVTRVGMLAVAAGADDEATKKDMKALTGTWRIVSEEREGTELGDEELKGAEAIYAADGRYSMVRGGDKPVYEGTFEIDATTEPKTIDFTQVSEGRTEGRVIPGIYEIEGDTLRVCRTTGGKGRPTGFSAPAGSGRVLLFLKKRE